MKNDIVNRIDVLRELAPFRGYITDKYLDKLIAIMSELPPAEKPMSAVEYIIQKRRLAESFSGLAYHRDCILSEFQACVRVANPYWETSHPVEAVAIVQKWAQERPEEVVK